MLRILFCLLPFLLLLEVLTLAQSSGKETYKVKVTDDSGTVLPSRYSFSFNGGKPVGIDLSKYLTAQVALPAGLAEVEVMLLNDVSAGDRNLSYEVKTNKVTVQADRVINIVVVPALKISFSLIPEQGNVGQLRDGLFYLSYQGAERAGRLDVDKAKVLFRVPPSWKEGFASATAKFVQNAKTYAVKVEPSIYGGTLFLQNGTVRRIIITSDDQQLLKNIPVFVVNKLKFKNPGLNENGAIVLQEKNINFTAQEAATFEVPDGYQVEWPSKPTENREERILEYRLRLSRPIAKSPAVSARNAGSATDPKRLVSKEEDKAALLVVDTRVTEDIKPKVLANSQQLEAQLKDIDLFNQEIKKRLSAIRVVVNNDKEIAPTQKENLLNKIAELEKATISTDSVYKEAISLAREIVDQLRNLLANGNPAIQDSIAVLAQQIERLEMEKQVVVREKAEAEVDFRRNLLAAAVIGALFLVFGVGSYIAARRISLQKDEIAKQNSEILHKNEEITRQNDQLLAQQTEISRKNHFLLEMNNEKNNLMDIVAHDLKAPLNKMVGVTQLLPVVGDLNDEQRMFVDIIRRSAVEGTRFINDLLDVNAIEQGLVQPLAANEIGLAIFVPEILKGFQQEASAKNIRIHFQNKTEQGLAITDQQYLRRIVDNLVSNAIKFANPGSNIYVKLAETPDQFRVAIKDEGPGICDEDQKKLFKKFQRLTARPTAGESSTGIGLSIVKVLVERLHGDIKVNSVVGKGTEFTVSLPKNTPIA